MGGFHARAKVLPSPLHMHDHTSTKLLHWHGSQTGSTYGGVPSPFYIEKMQDLDQKPSSRPGPASSCLPGAPTAMPPRHALLSWPHGGEGEAAAPLKGPCCCKPRMVVAAATQVAAGTICWKRAGKKPIKFPRDGGLDPAPAKISGFPWEEGSPPGTVEHDHINTSPD